MSRSPTPTRRSTSIGGYDVQALDRDLRIASGELVVGAKLGLTSVAKQQRMQVNQPIVGFLTDAMRVTVDSLAAAVRAWARPRIEPEIAFLTARAINAAPRRQTTPSTTTRTP